MKKLKRAGVLVLALMIGLMSFTGCAAKEEKPKVTITIKTPPISIKSSEADTTDDIMVMLQEAGDEFAKQYEAADVTVKVIKFQYEDEDKFITQTFGTEDAADVLFEGYFNMSGYIHNGYAVPLDDIISEELRGDVDKAIWDISSLNGKTYMMPFNSFNNTLIYNKEMFRQCGLEAYIADGDVIASWTTDEWNTILDTLAEKLPEMAYPMMMYAANDQGDTHIMTLIRSHGSKFFDKDGRFNINTPEGIEALKVIRDGVDKGWYPNGCSNLAILDCNDLFSNNQLAIHMANTAIENYNDNVKYGRVNFPSLDGKGYTTSFVTGFMVFDNDDADKLAASKAFVKYFYDSDKYPNYALNGQPALNSVVKANAGEIFMAEAYADNAKNAVNFTGNNPNWRGVRNVFWTHIKALLEGTVTPEECAAAIDKDCNAAIEEGYKNSTIHE
ncbi:ABC transporter substrate-binding protein [Frisingicoccus sp.]|uniref:ABC transporter substrate-binding protein n=1 Tax=Frisingicoccus sp. TaxID=1918627 RepID=UPI003AB1D055